MKGKIIVCLVGANGKMGKAILQVIAEDPFPNFGEIITVDSDLEKGPVAWADIATVDVPFDVVINFTNPEATLDSARKCSEIGKPLVTGTTGLNEDQIAELKERAAMVPIVWARNMSLGVNLIDSLLPELARVLQEFDVEIVETHHRAKKDSPSGTAVIFAETIGGVRNQKVAYGRPKGVTDLRRSEIFVHSLRGGSVPGTHEICFLGPDEEIIIIHRALSRKIFAKGAVLAAKWIIGKEPGLYSMADVLGLKK
jgi:4-hydroxy-tetrahydrodipicolinate reductase